MLSYPKPCECTEVIMGGGSLKWPPKRLYTPVLVDRPLVSNDIEEIRKHYGLKCDDTEDVCKSKDVFFCLFVCFLSFVLFCFVFVLFFVCLFVLFCFKDLSSIYDLLNWHGH